MVLKGNSWIMLTDLEPSQLPNIPFTDRQSEPTTDTEPEPASKQVAEPKPKPNTAPEPEPSSESAQMREPATPSVPEGILVEYKGMRWSPAHTLAAEGELCQVRMQFFEKTEKIIPCRLPSLLVPPSSKSLLVLSQPINQLDPPWTIVLTTMLPCASGSPLVSRHSAYTKDFGPLIAPRPFAPSALSGSASPLAPL